MKKPGRWIGGLVSIAVVIVVFIVPFVFVVLMASKTAPDASNMEFTLPKQWALLENIQTVLSTRNGLVIRAFVNSTVLSVVSVALMVLLAAAVGYVSQRRRSRASGLVNFLVLAGLIVPPAVVPTIWVLQWLGLFKTLPGLILIEVAYALPFCVLMFRAFVATVPRELDEAAVIDGAGAVRVFLLIVMPLLKPVIVTVVVIQLVNVFNDFQNPLYFLPGDQGATVQLTLYNFMSQLVNQWNLVFADVLLITILPLIMYIFFNRQIVSGMTSGAIKG